MSKRTPLRIELLLAAPTVLGVACNLSQATTETAGDESSTGSASSTMTGTGTGTDTGAATETTGAPDGAVTIYDIQKGMVAPKSTVTVKSVVVTTPVKVESGKNAVFVQEKAGGEYSGIYLYLFDEVAAALDVQPGDVVDVTGVYDEFFDSSQITVKKAGDITKVGSGPELAPAVVTPADVANGGAKAEAYESVLVEVVDVTVTNPDLGFGEFQVDGVLPVDDFFYFGKTPKFSGGEVIDSVVGVMLYNFEAFKLAPRGLEDISGIGGGSTTTDTTTTTTGDPTTGDTTTGGGGEVTIYDIQMGKVAAKSPVKVVDVVVTSPLTFKKDGFFVQEAGGGEFSGIYVFAKDPAGLAVKPGDVVSLVGTYDEFYMNSQIVIQSMADVSVTGTAPVPDPEVVAPGDVATSGGKAEAYEGVLVRVEGVTVTNADLGFGEWSVTGGLRVDDLFFAAAMWPKVMVGDAYASITGCMNYSFDNTKISPRTLADLVK